MTLALALSIATCLLQKGDPVADWTEDVLHFVDELERMHPDPFFGCPREEFDVAVDEFLGSLEERSETQRLAGFMALGARLSEKGRDGHSGVWPMRGHCLPFQVYGFADGWFVVESPQNDLVGARIDALGGVPMEEACKRVGPLLTVDNEWNRRLKLALALATTEILDGVGLAEDPTRVRVRLERAGKTEELVLAGENTSPLHLFGRPALPARSGVAWLEGREQTFRMQVLEAERALYVQYNEVQAQDGDGKSMATFAHEMVATFEGQKLGKLIVDVRSNGGGNNTTFGPLIAALQTPSINRPGVLFGLIGRATFSAAGNFVTVLERDTKAILIGEPTGGAPNQYGDAKNVPLPNHPDVLARVSTRYHQFGAAGDARLTHEPNLSVPLTSQDYFAGRDPVLQAALTYQPPR
jgi:hypothetical protein